jgi:hypothetical protein
MKERCGVAAVTDDNVEDEQISAGFFQYKSSRI